MGAHTSCIIRELFMGHSSKTLHRAGDKQTSDATAGGALFRNRRQPELVCVVQLVRWCFQALASVIASTPNHYTFDKAGTLLGGCAREKLNNTTAPLQLAATPTDTQKASNDSVSMSGHHEVLESSQNQPMCGHVSFLPWGTMKPLAIHFRWILSNGCLSKRKKR